jgi:predicted DsbA family dithiol-disulfide isomerase
VTPADGLEVYADIWCPFAHVGLRAAVASRARLASSDVALVIRAWPLELVNAAPMDPVATADHIRDLRAQVAPGLFAGFDPGRFPVTTLPALALGELAYRRGPRVGEAMSLALRDALFEEGRDISRPDVLAEMAARFGLDPPSGDEAVLESWRAGQARGVLGSPHFFCRDRDAFCPSLDIERDARGHLLVRRNAEKLESFLAACFAPAPAARGT